MYITFSKSNHTRVFHFHTFNKLDNRRSLEALAKCTRMYIHVHVCTWTTDGYAALLPYIKCCHVLCRGQTALHKAAWYQRRAICYDLIANGASLTRTDLQVRNTVATYTYTYLCRSDAVVHELGDLHV